MKIIAITILSFIILPNCSKAQWERLNVPAPHIVTIDALDGDLYVLGHDDSNYLLYASQDGGFDWSSDTVYPTSFKANLSLNGAIELYKLKAVTSKNIYITGYFVDEWRDCFSAQIGLFLRSSDSGWETLGSSGTLSWGAEIVNSSKDTILFLKGGALLCGDWGDSPSLQIYVDSGRTFTHSISQLYGLYYAFQSNHDIAYVLSMPNDGGLAITHNAGETWDTVLVNHQLANIESSRQYWRATSYSDSAWYSTDGVNWTFDPAFELPPSTKLHYKWTGDSLLTSIDSGRTFALHSRLSGKIKTIDTSGDVIYAQVGDTAVYRFPADARSVETAPLTSEILIAPNPANTYITVRTSARGPWTLHENTGRYIRTMVAPTERISILDLPNGAYFLNIDGRLFKFNIER